MCTIHMQDTLCAGHSNAKQAREEPEDHASRHSVVGSKFCPLGLFCMFLGNRRKSMQNDEQAVESSGNSAIVLALQAKFQLEEVDD